MHLTIFLGYPLKNLFIDDFKSEKKSENQYFSKY